jgi:L-fuculose-phosphate aldolase
VNYFTEDKTRELLSLKTQWGFKDARLEPGMENCDICSNDVFRSSWKDAGIERRAFEAPPAMGPRAKASKSEDTPMKMTPSAAASTVNGTSDAEALIRTITDRVIAALNTNPTR